MLQSLQQALSGLHVDDAVDRRSLTGAIGLLSECPLYVQAVEQLVFNEVEVSTNDIKL
jgi:hypothetical protein